MPGKPLDVHSIVTFAREAQPHFSGDDDQDTEFSISQESISANRGSIDIETLTVSKLPVSRLSVSKGPVTVTWGGFAVGGKVGKPF